MMGAVTEEPTPRQDVERRRKALGWSQRELARRAGIDISVVNPYLRGVTRFPDPLTVHRVDEALASGERERGLPTVIAQTVESPSVSGESRTIVIPLPAGSLAGLDDLQIVELVNVGSACILERLRRMRSDMG